MSFVIRRWVRTNKSTRQREYREIVMRSRQVTIGRAQDQQLLITDPKVAPQHAIIEQRSSSKIVIKALTPRGFLVNRKPRKVATLSQGDIVRIGAGAITVDQLRPGRPVILGFGHMNEPDPTEIKNLYITSIRETGLSKSFWSWALALSIIALFMLIPFSGVVYSALQEPLRSTPMIPSDGIWTSGPLHASHKSIGANCNSCHEIPFRMVRNDQCVACHDSMQHHVDVLSKDDVQVFEVKDETRCGSCHHEHNEPSTLAHQDQRLCTDCHEKLDGLKKQPELLNVADFGTNHPNFRLSILEARGQGAETLWERVRIPPSALKGTLEGSHLNFSHAQHLDPKGIKAPAGDQVLQCDDCHRMSANGKRMQPIKMETQCSRCHSLLFDAQDGNTKVPHGDLKLMYKALTEHFSRQFFEPTGPAPDTSVSSTGRRRPGGAVLMTTNDQRRASDWIEQKTMQTARQLLEDRVCVDCHVIEKVPEAVGIDRWIVDPVRLTEEWMPMAKFDHKSHTTSTCVSCHKNAERSEKSSDIMMPGIETCRDCHGGAADKEKLTSDCLMCHEFHLPNRGLFDANATKRMKGVLNAASRVNRKNVPAQRRTSDAAESARRSAL